MVKYLIAVVLIVHGFIVCAQSLSNFKDGSSQPGNPSWLGWWPTTLGRSWFLINLKLEGTLVDKIFGLIWLASGICIIAAALGVFGFVIPNTLWRTLAIYGASGSLIMLFLYLHPLFIIGILVNIGILVSLLCAKWPPVTLIGG